MIDFFGIVRTYQTKSVQSVMILKKERIEDTNVGKNQ